MAFSTILQLGTTRRKFFRIIHLILYFDANLTGLTDNSTNCSDTQRGVSLSQPFFDWLNQNNKKGIFTEYGISGSSYWLSTLDNFYNALEINPTIVGGTFRSDGPFWEGYSLSVEPI